MPLDNPTRIQNATSVYLGRQCEKAGNYREDRSSATANPPIRQRRR